MIGVFDSGFGGLTILKSFVDLLPQYDYLYLGDNARAPYGSRSFETVYSYTLDAVKYLFNAGCKLVILACNTASAKALRSIQQLDLPKIAPDKRVLGVIRPTAEAIDSISKTRHVGILATRGTVMSASYPIEIRNVAPDINVFQEACPMWVPLIENNEYNSPGADYFVKLYITKLLAQSPKIDTFILGCTHYPILLPKIRQFTPEHIQLLPQGAIIAQSLKTYLAQHPEIDSCLEKNAKYTFLTTDSTDLFNTYAQIFFGQPTNAVTVSI